MNKIALLGVKGMTSPEKLPKVLKLIVEQLEQHDEEITSLRRVIFDFLLKKTDLKTIPVPVPTPVTSKFEDWSSLLLFAATLFGEARGASKEEKIAIAWVVKNRMKKDDWYGKDLKEVILKPYQFSCFNKSDPNRKKLLNPLKYEPFPVWAECYEIAKKVENNEIPDPTDGATHYFGKSLADNPPKWAKELEFKKKIGEFYFYG